EAPGSPRPASTSLVPPMHSPNVSMGLAQLPPAPPVLALAVPPAPPFPDACGVLQEAAAAMHDSRSAAMARPGTIPRILAHAARMTQTDHHPAAGMRSRPQRDSSQVTSKSTSQGESTDVCTLPRTPTAMSAPSKMPTWYASGKGQTLR